MIAKLGVATFFWSFLSSFLRRIPGVTIKSNISFVLDISEAGQITPSTPHSFASLTIIQDKLISLVINTPTFANEYTDGWKIRRLSHETGVAVVSSVREAEAFLKAFLETTKSFEDMEAIQKVS